MTLYKHVLCQLRSAQQHTINKKSEKVRKKISSMPFLLYNVLKCSVKASFSLLVAYKVRKSREITLM